MLQGISVAVLAIFVVVIAVRTWLRSHNITVSNSILASPKQIQDYQDMCSALPADSTAPEPFASAAKDLFQTYISALGEMEAKATSILGFVGGGTSIVAVLGASVDRNLVFTPLLAFSGSVLTLVLLSSILALYPQVRKSPNVAAMANANTLAAANGGSYVNAWMGEQYVEAARQCVPILMRKSYLVRSALELFVIAVVALVINFLSLARQGDHRAQPIKTCISHTQQHCQSKGEEKGGRPAPRLHRR